MKTKKNVVFIFNDLGLSKNGFILKAKHFNCDFKNFAYPEDFEEWLIKEPSAIQNIKLIVLGQYFPGDGSKQRESGPSRGILFYKRLLENDNFKKIPLILIAEIEKQEEYLKKCKEYKVTLRDTPVDIMKFSGIYRQKLKMKN